MPQEFIVFIKHLINGAQIGSIYALVALGYTMVYGIVRLINFAHGDVIMVGAYTSIVAIPVLTALGLPKWLCVFAAILACSALGILTERVAYRPLRGCPRISALITAIAVSLLLQNMFMVLFTSSPRAFPQIFDIPEITLAGISVNGVSVLTITTSAILMVILHVFIQKTKLGRAMRAVSEDSAAATLMGIHVDRTISMTFAIGSGLAAIASVMYGSIYPLIDPYMGAMLGLKAFIAAVLGGIGVIPGAMLGGLAIGFVESLTKAYINSQLSDAVVFGILILVLIAKPEGIFGKNVGEKV